MGKRSDFKRRDRDFYPTPVKAVEPLIPHLPSSFTYVEPCAGGGDLIDASDIEPGISKYGVRFVQKDAFDIEDVPRDIDFFITNPPWDRNILHPLIIHLIGMRPTWLLFDADWMHTRQSAPYLRNFCKRIVSVGRIKWIPNSPHTGKDNCAWYLFDERDPNQDDPTVFCGRDHFSV
jgi:hypothetical protein